MENKNVIRLDPRKLLGFKNGIDASQRSPKIGNPKVGNVKIGNPKV